MQPSLIQNKYQLQQCIGQGKFGKVFLGQNIYTNSPVAIKMETKDVSLLKREATFLRYLHDRGATKYIPTLLWFGVSQEQPCLVMSYCSDGILANLTIHRISQCISALEAIHKHQVVHRDIKPQNFMLTMHGTVQLIDFGLADFIYDNPDSEPGDKTTILGTPRYASPYIHLGKVYTYRDDMISLGYVFIHLLTNGEYPQRPNINPSTTTTFPVESIHHPTNVEIAQSKKIDRLRGCNFPPIIQYLEYFYSIKPNDPIDYEAAIRMFTE